VRWLDTALHRLDRTPRRFAVEFLVAEIAPASAHAAEFRALSGSFEEIRTKLDALHKRGAITTVKRHEFRIDGSRLAAGACRE
jgi:hypothetical protein